MTDLGVAALLCVAVPLKAALFFWLFCRFRLRARNSFLASLSLSNYSEFGLIVAAVGLKQGWIPVEWLTILALAVSITFIVASPLNSAAHSLWTRFGSRLRRFESESRLPEDEHLDAGEVEAVVIGMDTMGEHAYDVLREQLGEGVIGLDRDPRRVSAQRAAGRRVLLGDSTDPDLYERLARYPLARRLLLLMFSNHQEKLTTVRLLREAGRTPFIATLAMHEDEVQELQEAGVQIAVDLAGEAGRGFARDVLQVIEETPPTEQGAGE